MIKFRCDKCDEEMEIPDRMAGKTVRCVECEARLTVPDPDEVRPVTRARRNDDDDDEELAGRRRRERDRYDDEYDDDDYESRGRRRRDVDQGGRLTRRELRQVAALQRYIILAIMMNLVLAVIFKLSGSDLRFAIGIVYLLVGLGGLVCVVMLSLKVYSTAVAIIFAVLMLAPLLNLIVLLIVNQKATSELKRKGYRVGLLGVSPSEFD